MKQWVPLALIAIVIGVAAIGFSTGADRIGGHSRTEVGQVVTTSDGETLVIFDRDRGGFFPVGFLIIPLFWFLVIGLVFSRFRGGPWRGAGPDQKPPQAWFDEWHRSAHSDSTDHSSGVNP